MFNTPLTANMCLTSPVCVLRGRGDILPLWMEGLCHHPLLFLHRHHSPCGSAGVSSGCKYSLSVANACKYTLIIDFIFHIVNWMFACAPILRSCILS